MHAGVTEFQCCNCRANRAPTDFTFTCQTMGIVKKQTIAAIAGKPLHILSFTEKLRCISYTRKQRGCMLLEALKYLNTPCAPHFKSMGYLHELIAMEGRYNRCRTAWQSHLEQTKSVIKDAIRHTAGSDKAIVLGAGILSDIPLHALSTHFKTVELLDICFLKSTKKKAQQYRNVQLRAADITGLVADLHANAVIPPPSIPDNLELTNADLVISANILSQLPVIPILYLQKKNQGLGQAELTAFEQDVIQSHIELLNRCTGTICLVTEVERTFLNDGQVIESEDMLSGFELGIEGHSWFWDLAPKGEASPDYAIRNRVIGEYWRNR